VERMRRLKIGVTAMAVLAWLTVLTGTWIVYPLYWEGTPDSPRSQLLANPDMTDWHEFGMEWKERIADQRHVVRPVCKKLRAYSTKP
jgi:hypothetical protein